MEIINKKHPMIEKNTGGRFTRFVSIISNRVIYFSAYLTVEYNLDEGTRIDFIKDDLKWSFVISNNPDAFVLSKKAKRRGVYLCSSPLIAMIKKKHKFKHWDKFPIKETGREIDGLPVIEILFNSPLPHKPLRR